MASLQCYLIAPVLLFKTKPWGHILLYSEAQLKSGGSWDVRCSKFLKLGFKSTLEYSFVFDCPVFVK